jgi:hypothetical protein
MTTVHNIPSINYLLVERALAGSAPLNELNSGERDFYDKYKSVFAIGRMAHRMAQGYYAHKAAIEVAKDPRANTLLSTTIRHGQAVPVGDVFRKNGTGHVYDTNYYLDYARTNPEMAGELERIWLVGSLIAVGDALSDHKYLDHAPVLELVYHLRNGVAHGNTFTFTSGKRKPGLDRLKNYPAHNKRADVKTAEFEIEANLEGQSVLFHFMGPGDVLDLLMSVETYLTRIRERQHAGELSDLLKAAAHP